MAAALLSQDGEPDSALHFLKEVNELLQTQRLAFLSRDIAFGGARRVWSTLQKLYEHSEDYEKALEMRRLRGVEAAPLSILRRARSTWPDG